MHVLPQRLAVALYSDWRRREVPCYLFSLAQQLFSEHCPFHSLFFSLSLLPLFQV